MSIESALDVGWQSATLAPNSTIRGLGITRVRTGIDHLDGGDDFEEGLVWISLWTVALELRCLKTRYMKYAVFPGSWRVSSLCSLSKTHRLAGCLRAAPAIFRAGIWNARAEMLWSYNAVRQAAAGALRFMTS